MSFRGDRLAVVPIELDSRARGGCARSCPRRCTNPGRSQVSMRVPKEGERALPERRPGGRRAARGRARGCLGTALRRPLNAQAARLVSARVPAVVSKTLRSIAALGAVFLPSSASSACGGGMPSNAVVQVDGTPITKAAFKHWMAVAAASRARAGDGRQAGACPNRPNYTACIAHLEATAPKPAKGQTRRPTAQLKTQCEQQYKALQQEVLRLPDLLLSGCSAKPTRWASRSPTRSQEAVREDQDQQFPKAAEFEKFLATSGQTVSDLLLRVKLNLLSTKIQQKIVKNEANVTKAQITKYYNENKSRYGTPEKRTVEPHPHEDRSRGEDREEGNRIRQELRQRRQDGSIDPTSKATAACSRSDQRPGGRRPSTKRSSPPQLNVLERPGEDPFGYYIYEVNSSHARHPAELRAGASGDQAQLTATQQQTALSKFVKEFKKKWTAKRTAARDTWSRLQAVQSAQDAAPPPPGRLAAGAEHAGATPATPTTRPGIAGAADWEAPA